LRELITCPFVGETATAFEIRVLDLLNGRLIFFTFFEFFFEVCSSGVNNLVVLSVLQRTFSNQFLSIRLRHRLHGTDDFVHLRLSESRLIDLIVAVLPETDHVKKHIFAIFLPISHSKFANTRNSLNIMSVDTNDRDSERFDNV
jgi:hypothetical protein